MRKSTFTNRMQAMDEMLQDKIGLTHQCMPDISWWDIIENSDSIEDAFEQAMETWVENGDLPAEAYDW